MHSKRGYVWLAVLGLVILVVAGGIVLWRSRHEQNLPISHAIRHQISFVIYMPADSWTTTAPPSPYAGGILTLTAQKDSQRLTLTEQATPDVFNDIPAYYPTLLGKLNKYASVGSVNGTAYLTKPVELKGQQQAVLNKNGTLLFVHPSSDMSINQWRRFFNNLQPVKPGY